MKRVAAAFLITSAIVAAMLFSGCAGYTAQQGAACAAATLSALANAGDLVVECRAAAKTKGDDEVQQCVKEALETLSSGAAAIPACLPQPPKEP